jgi:hypothetical protein
MSVEIQLAAPDRARDLAVLLGRAFRDDPILTWPFFTDNDEARTTETFTILDDHFSRAELVWEVPRARAVAM